MINLQPNFTKQKKTSLKNSEQKLNFDNLEWIVVR